MKTSIAVGLVIALLVPSCAAPQDRRAEGTEVLLSAKDGPSTVASEPRPLAIRVDPEGVGDRFEHTSRIEITGQIMARGSIIPIRSTTKAHYTVDVLAVDAERTLKQRVRYLAFEDRDDPPPAEPNAEPVIGKAYVLERKGDALVITDDAGAPVGGNELKYLEKSWKRFGLPKKTRGALAKARLRVGEDNPDLAAAYAADASDEESTFKGVSMRLQETRGDVAVFDYAMKGTSSALKGAVLRVRGTREVSLSTGELLRDSGAMTIEGGALETGLTFDIEGNGEETTKRL